jgi:hypothetical protein
MTKNSKGKDRLSSITSITCIGTILSFLFIILDVIGGDRNSVMLQGDIWFFCIITPTFGVLLTRDLLLNNRRTVPQ